MVRGGSGNLRHTGISESSEVTPDLVRLEPRVHGLQFCILAAPYHREVSRSPLRSSPAAYSGRLSMAFLNAAIISLWLKH